MTVLQHPGGSQMRGSWWLNEIQEAVTCPQPYNLSAVKLEMGAQSRERKRCDSSTSQLGGCSSPIRPSAPSVQGPGLP